MAQKEFRALSHRARSLLKSREDAQLDYKRKASALSSEDLVAFANSDTGGTLLIGVDESVDANGSQCGKIVGCPIGDKERLGILSKAQQCFPPVTVEIHVENTASTPFLRVEVPPSASRPHCTNGGTYKIRHDGSNATLQPGQLLTMFMEREARAFQERFSEATRSVEAQMDYAAEILEELKQIVMCTTSEISESVSWAFSEAESAACSVRNVSADTEKMTHLLRGVQRRLKALAEHLKAPDPVTEEAKQDCRHYVRNRLISDRDSQRNTARRRKVQIGAPDCLRELTPDEWRSIVRDVADELGVKAMPDVVDDEGNIYEH